MKFVNKICENILKLYIIFIIIYNFQFIFNINLKDKFGWILDVINYFYILGIISVLALFFIKFINKYNKEINYEEKFLIILISISFILLIIPIRIENIIYLVILSIITVIPIIIFFIIFLLIYKLINELYFKLIKKINIEYINLIFFLLFWTLNIFKIYISKYIK